MNESRQNVFYWKCDSVQSVEEKRQSYFSNKYNSKLTAAARSVACDFVGTESIDFQHLNVDGNHFVYKFTKDKKNYLLRTDDGLGEDNYMLAESSILNELIKNSLPVPNVYETNIEMNDYPFRYQILEFIDAVPLIEHYKENILNLDSIAQQSGKFLSTLHQHQFSGFGFIDTEYLKKTNALKGIDLSWKVYFEKCLTKHLKYLKEKSLLPVTTIKKITELIQSNINLLDISKGSLLHRDFALWNILGSTDRIKAVIDWDDAVIGDPADDIAMVNCFMEKSYTEILMKEYTKTNKIDSQFKQRISLYTLRNMLWKTVIRHFMGYFKKDDSFFLNKNSEGLSLKDYTFKKIHTAIEELS